MGWLLKLCLVVEVALADEFTQQRCLRDRLVKNRYEVFDELKQPLRVDERTDAHLSPRTDSAQRRGVVRPFRTAVQS